MKIGVPKETFPGERRVALIPPHVAELAKKGIGVVIERGAGLESGFSDEDYRDKGAEVGSRDDAFAAEVVAQVRGYGANLEHGAEDLARCRDGQILLASCDPLGEPNAVKELAEKGVLLFALELVPRITRAQSMDTLSSMATIAGYKAVLLAANTLPKIFPMFMTAAGTIKPSKVFIIGAGVAGLQAIATARRLGALVQAYDVRPAVKEQVESLGATFVEMELDAGESEDKGGYAKAMDDEFYRKQRELMMEVVRDIDVVITTAAIPGRKSPILITDAMVQAMPQGSVIIDLAAERGGNCENTKLDEVVVSHGVTILGPGNLASTIPQHASQMYGKNIINLLAPFIKEGNITFDFDDEVIQGTLTTRGGDVTHPRLREILGLPELETAVVQGDA
jgi:NAD(P) transhydrogenase subunit alpha